MPMKFSSAMKNWRQWALKDMSVAKATAKQAVKRTTQMRGDFRWKQGLGGKASSLMRGVGGSVFSSGMIRNTVPWMATGAGVGFAQAAARRIAGDEKASLFGGTVSGAMAGGLARAGRVGWNRSKPRYMGPSHAAARRRYLPSSAFEEKVI